MPLTAVSRHALLLPLLMLSLAHGQLLAESIVTPTDTIPDFGAGATVVSVASGNWSAPSTWSGGEVPGAGDVVAIAGGTSVTYDLASPVALSAVVVRAGGTLAFATGQTTAMTVVNLEVLPAGTLSVGTESAPIAPGVTATITIADQPIDTGLDPYQYGNGIVGFGTVSMCGQPRAPSYARLAVLPQAGDTTLQLQAPVSGWQVGDRLILPDSRHLNWDQHPNGCPTFEIETLGVRAISGGGQTINLTTPLAYSHPGGWDAYGHLEYLPHVEDLSRNVVVTSQNPQGTRGHVLMTWQAVVDIRWTAFVQLGRTLNIPLDNTTAAADGTITHIGTNQIGRYPLHMHHLIGPATAPANGYQFTLIGNAIDGGDTEATAHWGIDIHGSYYGLVHGNVVYNTAGAGITTEDGSECNNLIDHNCVFWVNGTGGREDYGWDGVGFWLHGDNNYVDDNVAADIEGGVYCYGYNIFQYYLGDVQIPAAQGEEPSVTINSYTTPILDFSRNECYCSPNGMTYWWIGTFGGIDPPAPPAESVVRDLVVWNQYQWGIFAYQSYDLTIDGMVCRGDPAVLNSGNGAQGIEFADYSQRDLIVRHCDFQNLGTGMDFSTQGDHGSQTVDSCFFRCYNDMAVPGVWSVSAWGATIGPRLMVASNCTCDISQYGVNGANTPIWPTAVLMALAGRPTRNYIQSDQFFLYGYNGDASTNYQLMYPEQVASWILPQTTYNADGSENEIGSPVAGLTNAQNWSTYGIALAGAVAPADALTLPDFQALAAPIDASTQPVMRSTTTTPEVALPPLPADVDTVATAGGSTTSTGGSTGSGSSTGGGGGSTSPGTGGAGATGGVSSGGGSGGHCGMSGLTGLVLGCTLLAWRGRSLRRRR